MTRTPTVLFLGIALFSLATPACQRSRAATGATSAPSATQTSAAKPDSAKVARIVFVGKEHACDCTRKTVNDSWAVLQKALGTPAKLPVERIQVDTEAARVEPYRQQKPIMALPAIYFVDGKNAVIELLQGEVTAEQVASVLYAR